jgi:SHS2 domain-containing protein
MPYTYLEHKADLFIEAIGKNFEDALESAAQGMFDAISKVKAKDKIEITIEADSLEDLVVRTLSDLLSQSEIEETPFSKFKVKAFERSPKFKIMGIAYGEKDAPKKSSVKAVTYHALFVKEEKGKTTIRVLVDI